MADTNCTAESTLKRTAGDGHSWRASTVVEQQARPWSRSEPTRPLVERVARSTPTDPQQALESTLVKMQPQRHTSKRARPHGNSWSESHAVSIQALTATRGTSRTQRAYTPTRPLVKRTARSTLTDPQQALESTLVKMRSQPTHADPKPTLK